LKKLARKCCKVISYELQHTGLFTSLPLLLVESFGGCSVMFSAEAASSSMLFADASDV
jgi:hypothetical protein